MSAGYYTYRGSGHDTLTDGKGTRQLADAITAFEGPGWTPPLGYEAIMHQPCGTPAAYRRRLRNGQQPCRACAEAESLRSQAAKRLRCPCCRYRVTSPNHRILCGGAA